MQPLQLGLRRVKIVWASVIAPVWMKHLVLKCRGSQWHKAYIDHSHKLNVHVLQRALSETSIRHRFSRYNIYKGVTHRFNDLCKLNIMRKYTGMLWPLGSSNIFNPKGVLWCLITRTADTTTVSEMMLLFHAARHARLSLPVRLFTNSMLPNPPPLENRHTSCLFNLSWFLLEVWCLQLYS